MTTTTEQIPPVGTRHLEALQQRNAKYAMKFVNDSGNAMPTDARLAEVLANCTRPPRPDEFPAIRQHVYTYLDGREAGRRSVSEQIHDRIESYASDAHKFSNMAELGETGPMTADECKRFAAMYRTIAGELRKVAASL